MTRTDLKIKILSVLSENSITAEQAEEVMTEVDKYCLEFEKEFLEVIR